VLIKFQLCIDAENVQVHGAVLPSAETDGVPGYGIDELIWEITLGSGSEVSLNGTLEQVASQLNELDPGWADKAEARDVEMSPIKRTVFNYNDVRCGTFGVTTSPNSIIVGIRHLRGVGGKPTNGPGPGNCGKVSCSNKAAIWWCNDVSLQDVALKCSARQEHERD
jgi:hypothetical protein